MIWLQPDRPNAVIFGNGEDPPEPGSQQIQGLRSGRTVLHWQPMPALPARVFMMKCLDAGRPDRGYLCGEIDTTYLWGLGSHNSLPPMTEISVTDDSGRLLVSSLTAPGNLLANMRAQLAEAPAGVFDWQGEEETFLAAYWTVFLRGMFSGSDWVVTLSQAQEDVRAPMADFRRNFPLIVALCFLVVLLLSLVFIRRSLVPLEVLKRGTQQVAMGDFQSRVTVTSQDEFQELGESFNRMAERLQKHFNVLNTMAEIDRAILSSLDTERIVRTVLHGLQELLSCPYTSITLTDATQHEWVRTYAVTADPRRELRSEPVHCSWDGMIALFAGREMLFLDDARSIPAPFRDMVPDGIRALLFLPVLVRGKLSGVAIVGYPDPAAHRDENGLQARRMADQMAVALANSTLVDELDGLNRGTIHALARAVDAKSKWTAGHSERVTDLSLRLGEVLQLGQRELGVLHRAALLHDIGKIGVSSGILNKNEGLTTEEFRLIEEHPRIGARILEPIAAYAEVIPIVLQHHERYDGSGYPAGLSGNAIVFGARIVAVADVFDALISDRPYRSGCSLDHALGVIVEGAGTQFDPVVTQALLSAFRVSGKAALERSHSPSHLRAV
jgi:putative nucleotidyltransferase with HDIG domain